MAAILLPVVAVVTLAAAACSGSDDGGGPALTGDAAPTDAAVTEDTGFPVTVTGANGEVTLDSARESIVSLSPTATESLFAIGAGDQVTAVDDQSNFPPEAPVSALSGLEPNVEAMAEFDPDLVIAQFDPGDLVAALETIDVPVLIQPAATTLDEAYAQMETLGAATGRIGDAAEVVGQMQTDIDAAVAGPSDAEGLTYFHELDDTLFTATSSTFIGEIYALFGLENIADPADDGTGFPQLSAEFLVDADPDLVLLADTVCCGQDAATFGARPGFDVLTAVTGGNVIELDDDVASRWGPRVADFVAAIGAAIPVGAGT